MPPELQSAHYIKQILELREQNAELLAMLWRMHKAAYEMGDRWPSEGEVCSLITKAEKLK